MKRTLLLIIGFAVFTVFSASAQKLVWDLGFNYKFDNREYQVGQADTSGTYYGVRLTPQIGIGWGKGSEKHQGSAIIIGVDLMTDFGARSFETKPEFLCYYRYKDDSHGFYAGRFPRHNLIGDYSYAFFSEYVRFYDNNLDGLLFNYRSRRGYVELAFDWNSLYAPDRREKFMIFSSGQWGDYGPFFFGYNFNIYHHAGSVNVRGVVDNMLLYPYAGLDFAKKTKFSKLSMQLGWLQAFQNDRRYVGEYVTPGRFQIDIKAEYWGFGIYNSFSTGKSIMPYYNSTVDGQPDYRGSLYMGEPFYGVDGIYNRLEVYWARTFMNSIGVRVASVHHYTGGKWDWQQILSLQIYLSDNMFGKKKN